MKSLIQLLTVLCLIVMMSHSASAQVRLGLKAGINLANLNWDDDFQIETEMLPTFMVGGVAEFDFSENLSLGTGLQYYGRGFQDEDSDDLKVTLSYIQVPIQLQYRSSGLFAAVGPYVGFGIGGKSKDANEEVDVEFGSGVDDDFSALDYGVNLEVGYEFGDLRATALYGLGLANVIPEDLQFEDLTIKHTVIGIALTYLFGGEE